VSARGRVIVILVQLAAIVAGMLLGVEVFNALT
jgi:hypothetical protein